jgi:hypothetical protein
LTFDHMTARRALNDSRHAPLVRLLWRVLVDYAGQDGLCWPSVGTLALDCGVSERHVQRAIRTLQQYGHIEVTERRGETSLYRLNPMTPMSPHPVTRESPVVPSAPDSGVTPGVTRVSPTYDSGVTTPPTPVSPEQIRERIKNDPRKGEDAHAPDPPDLTDADAEAMCPMDLARRAADRGVIGDLAEKLRVPRESVEDAVRVFVGYWTIGKGAGQRRRHWMARLREDVRQKHERGKLRAPGEIRHGGGAVGGNATAAKLAAILEQR